MKGTSNAKRRNGRTGKSAGKKQRCPQECRRTSPQGGAPPTRNSAVEAADHPMEGQSSKVTLPGEMYLRTGRWWWRVKLPGEDRAKARPLTEPGAKEAASDRDTAERVAIEMWEHAITQNGAGQIASECAQKVERLKAQFLDKVRHLTEIVDAATAKAQAEARARAEVEAKLNVMIQTAEHKTMAPAVETQDLASPQPAECPVPCETKPDAAESVGCAMHTDSPQASEEARSTMENAALESPAGRDAAETVCTAHPAPFIPAESPHPHPQTGDCECCGAADIAATDLECIDSGQRLCPDCLRALRLDVSRIESRAFADSHA